MSLSQPAWLILLVLLPMLGVAAVLVARLRRKQWSAFVAPRLRRPLLMRGSPLPRWLALVFLLAACGAMIIALARPHAEAGTRTERTVGRNVLIALDLSRSMRVQDVKPDRLGQAKVVIFELLDALPNERIGLIGFAGSAYTYAPLTVDHRAVRETVEQIDESWAPLGGSNLAEALRLAIETLKQTGQRSNALVILSDGEKHDGDVQDLIAEAERSGIYILAIGVGTEDGGYVPAPGFPGERLVDRNGVPVLSRLQPDLLRQLATETKGRFAIAGSGTDIVGLVQSAIRDLDTFEMEGRERRVAVEFYQWLLLPGILFLIVSVVAGTRWRGVRPATALAAAAFAFALSPATASADAVSRAATALRKGDFQSAGDQYAKLAERSRLPDRRALFHLGEATAAYRGGDFRRARSAFSQAMLSGEPDVIAQGQHGLGNTLFQLGWRLLAGESYPDDAEATPDMADFDAKVDELLTRILDNADSDSDTPGGYGRLRSIITNWSDAVRHYDSLLAANPDDPAARQNRDMTVAYLRRLRELLDNETEATEQALPDPQPGEGDPQPGEGDPDAEPGDEDGEEGDDPQPGDRGESDEEPGEGNRGDQPDDDREGGDDPNEQQPRESGGEEPDGEEPDESEAKDPDETPEERARRILQENADLERGPLTPGRRMFRAPEKDW